MTKSPSKKYNPEMYDNNLPTVPMPETPDLDGDRLNFYLLITLYIIQGFPIGLATAIPMILQSRKMVNYEDQAIFSTVLWPFTLKLLWAPVVDALYVKWIGRRKSWLIPLQLLMGLVLFYMASNIDEWLPESGKPNLKMIVLVVFVLNFLSATQDIVVDGWSLTMMKKKNVSYVSACNSVGVTCGIFIGNVCFTLLVSDQFGNKYFGTKLGTGGIMSMKNILYCWLIMVLFITTLVGILKKENNFERGHGQISVTRNYKLLWKILNLSQFKILALALLTAKIGYIATESTSNLKLIDAGVSKDDIMIITTIMYSVKIIFPIFVSKYIIGQKTMDYYLKITPIRLIWDIIIGILIYCTPSLMHTIGADNKNILIYYFILGSIFLINEILSCFMILALFAFFCQISDPRFGGTYMTLFNTFYFSGWLLSNTLALKLVDIFTINACSVDISNTCSTQNLTNLCIMKGGSCGMYVDGYYIVLAISTLFGFVWFGVFRRIIQKYQSLGLSHWVIDVKQSITAESTEQCMIPRLENI